MRYSTTLVALLAISAPAAAQANDWAGISVRCEGVTPSPNFVANIVCGTPITCTPLLLSGTGGDTISYFVMGTFNGFYLMAGSVDTNNLGCLNLGIPGLVNDLVLNPGALVSLALGTMTVPDNGRCNGGASPLAPLLTIPPGLTGELALQAIVSAPLSAGGTGLAFTSTVRLRF